MKKFIALALASLMLVTATACAAPAAPAAPAAAAPAAEAAAPAEAAPAAEAPAEVTTIGVAMPTQSLQRWNQDGANMKASLEARGYKVDLQYAEDDVALQASQLENMITTGAKVLVIASIDGEALSDVIGKAKEAGIPVIAYDRLIKKSDIDYYATFDNFEVGVIQGKYIEENLGLKDGKGPFNIEFFGGSPDDNNAYFFNGGAMSILQPYLDNGQLVCPSGQIAMEQVAILGWKSEDAQSRMDNLLSANYADGKALDVVLSPNDSLAYGIASSLENNGFVPGQKWPIITGQDCDIANTKNMIAGKQNMSVFKDTRFLAEKVCEMVDAIVTGKEVPVNDTETYDNDIKVVPSYLLAPVYCDINNYKELLIDSGYYTEDQLA